jgi:hypothetical protein
MAKSKKPTAGEIAVVSEVDDWEEEVVKALSAAGRRDAPADGPLRMPMARRALEAAVMGQTADGTLKKPMSRPPTAR